MYLSKLCKVLRPWYRGFDKRGRSMAHEGRFISTSFLWGSPRLLPSVVCLCRDARRSRGLGLVVFAVFPFPPPYPLVQNSGSLHSRHSRRIVVFWLANSTDHNYAQESMTQWRKDSAFAMLTKDSSQAFTCLFVDGTRCVGYCTFTVLVAVATYI